MSKFSWQTALGKTVTGLSDSAARYVTPFSFSWQPQCTVSCSGSCSELMAVGSAWESIHQSGTRTLRRLKQGWADKAPGLPGDGQGRVASTGSSSPRSSSGAPSQDVHYLRLPVRLACIVHIWRLRPCRSQTMQPCMLWEAARREGEDEAVHRLL